MVIMAGIFAVGFVVGFCIPRRAVRLAAVQKPNAAAAPTFRSGAMETFRLLRVLSGRDNTGGKAMRTSIFAIAVAIGATIAPQTHAQQSTAPSQQMQPNQKVQDEADKGVKTRNSGESGFVADQEKPGAAAHPPGQPDKSTTGTSSAPGKSR
jgi:hypothetical protein